KEYREVRYVMGTLLDITLYHHDSLEARNSLDKAFALAQRLDDLLSNYKSQSEINRLNQRAGERRIKVSAELYHLLVLAKLLSERTGGAFDITVGPVMDLWKQAYETGQVPPGESLKATMAVVGSHHLLLHPNSEVELTQKGMGIDTGGIGKGFAVDRLVGLFKKRGIAKALVNFGHSSIYAMGSPPGDRAWKLLLQFPGQAPVGALELRDEALSASDGLGSSFQIGGKLYGHLVDPKTGLPTTKRIQAVVLGPTATEAEALSKYVILRSWPAGQDGERWGGIQVMRILESGEIQRSENFPFKPLP
ncbi:MAG: FAD:protein FMN transferase, partial [Deltaproteobacteria bacterium]|nr:FAD:protein FMN transferase [Deltaproteobacteria bacterium]